MKKIAAILLAMLSVLSLCAFVGCGVSQAKITGITYLSGMPETVSVKQTPDYSSLKIKVTYDDDTEKEVAYNAADFTVEFDNTVEAENVKVTIKYKGFTCETTVNVENHYEMEIVELPAFATAYLSVKDTDFKDKTAPYYVGNVNEFLFVPAVTAFDADDNMVRFDKSGDLEFVSEVSLVVNGAEQAIDNPAKYYAYDGQKSSFIFTADAADKTFRISVRPAELTEKQLENVGKYTVSFNVTVKDGYYNVYNADELTVMENRFETNTGDSYDHGKAMNEFRKSKGITVDVNAVKGLAIQANITVTTENLPAEYFWTESEVAGKNIVGSLKDYTYMYYRNLGSNGTFAIEGNYFTLNAESLPKILAEGSSAEVKPSDEIIAHAKMFYVLGQAQQNGSSDTEAFEMNNFNMLGNINRTDGDTSGEGKDFKSGGLILIESNGAKTDINNCIAKCWYITAFSSHTSEGHQVTVNKCIFEDDYNSIFYLWGGIIEVKESTTARAGGPVFIADHTHFDSTDSGRDGKGGWTSDIIVDEKSEVYSYVSGQEGWFKQLKATGYASQIVAMDQLFNLGGMSYVTAQDKSNVINLIAIYKAGSVESADELFENATKGHGKFGKNEFNMDGGYIDAFMNTSIGGGATIATSGMPVFYGSNMTTLMAFNPLDADVATKGYPLTVALALAEKGGMVTSADEYKALPMFSDNGGYVNMLFGAPGKSGKLGLVLGDFHSIKKA